VRLYLIYKLRVREVKQLEKGDRGMEKMTKEQEKRFINDLEKVAKCKVTFLRHYSFGKWSTGFENELGAYRVAWIHRDIQGIHLEYSKNLKIWTVSVS